MPKGSTGIKRPDWSGATGSIFAFVALIKTLFSLAAKHFVGVCDFTG